MKVFVSLLTFGALVGFKNVLAAPIDEAATIVRPCLSTNPNCNGPFIEPFPSPHGPHGASPHEVSRIEARDEDTTQRICPLGAEDCPGPIFDPEPEPCLLGKGICPENIVEARDEETASSFCPLGLGNCGPWPVEPEPYPEPLPTYPHPCPLHDEACNGPFHQPLTYPSTTASGKSSAIVAREPQRTKSYDCRDGDPTCYEFYGPKRDIPSADDIAFATSEELPTTIVEREPQKTRSIHCMPGDPTCWKFYGPKRGLTPIERPEVGGIDKRNSTLEIRDTSITYYYYPDQTACPGAPNGGWAGSVTIQNNACISIHENYARYIMESTCQLNFYLEPDCQGEEGTIYRPIVQQCLIPGNPFVSAKAVFC